MAGGGELQRGLYELLVTTGLAERLSGIDPELVTDRALHPAEAANRVALHLSLQIERALRAQSDTSRVETAATVVARTLELLQQEIANADLADEALDVPARLLHSVTGRRPDGSPRPIGAPMIPLLDTTLLTNAPGEPRVGHQLREEVDSADGIDVVMAFIRTSGIAPLLDVLQRHCDDGKPLRVLTTTYTGSMQPEALDRLVALGADVRVSYDTSTTRLHAKAWLFHRRSGFSTAYIGSSNLTHSAQVSGLEWNVRVSSARNADVIDKVRAVFDTYWEGGDFRPYVRDDFDRETARHGGSGPTVYLSPVAVTPQPFQQRMLDQLQVERQRGRHRNLIVSATGTGKTVMAALDYRRLRESLGRARLLFVAHRQEILDQSQATFRHVMHDASFGEQWVGGRRPSDFEHVFALVQTLANIDLAHLPADHFDVVIVDEFHHAAAASYDRLLAHLAPHELVGLTATPERADGVPVLHWFDDRIAAELRLWDAIDQHYLAPFAYYGISDGTRLEEIPWRSAPDTTSSGSRQVTATLAFDLGSLSPRREGWAMHGYAGEIRLPGKGGVLQFREFLEFNEWVNRFDQPCRLMVDLRSVAFAHPSGMAPIVALIDSRTDAGWTFDVALPEQDFIEDYFHKAGWINGIVGESSPGRVPGSTYIPLTRYGDHETLNPVLTEALDHFTHNSVYESGVLDGIEWALNEVADNVLNHAGGVQGWLQLAEQPKKGLLEIVVVDCGQGICSSLRERFPELDDDQEAIRRAVEKGVTRNPEVGQGNGLAGTLRIAIAAGGWVNIASGAGLLRYMPTSPIRNDRGVGKAPSQAAQNLVLDTIARFTGTVVALTIPTGRPIDVAQALWGHRPRSTLDIGYSRESGDQFDDKVVFSVASEASGFGNRHSARPVRQQLHNVLNSLPDRGVVVDFDGVNIASASFLDEFLARLIKSYGVIAFFRRVEIRNANDLVARTLDAVVDQRMRA